MTQKQQAGKRIVSKGAYVVLLSKQFGVGVISIASLLSLLLCLILSVVLPYVLLNELLELLGWESLESLVTTLISMVLCTALMGGATYGVYFFGRMFLNAMEQVGKTNDVVPLTRANIADLPAPESLVRASQEPAQAQEAVLLRAATGTQEGQEEHLMRAATGE